MKTRLAVVHHGASLCDDIVERLADRLCHQQYATPYPTDDSARTYHIAIIDNDLRGSPHQPPCAYKAQAFTSTSPW